MRDACDVLHDLNRAGVHIIVTNDRLVWRCDPSRPPVSGHLFLALKDHKDDVRRILQAIPDGCAVPDTCKHLGICPREIAHDACTSTPRKERS